MITLVHDTIQDLQFLDYTEDDYVDEHEIDMTDLVIKENCDCNYYLRDGGCAE